MILYIAGVFDLMETLANELVLIVRPDSCRMPTEGARKASEPRLVTVRRAGVEVGVTLCGGNLRGVYIDSLDEDSPARGPEGLLPGDLILEVGARWRK